MMMDSQLKNKIRNYCSVVNNEEGFITYEIQTEDIEKDEDKKIQVVAIGPDNNGPTKSVLLLGETGVGKTCVINTMINHLFGVSFEDNFRLQLKDQVLNNSLQVESQTEYITAYIVYHQPGMPYYCNYILIDTPGFGDTREDHERVTIDRLTAFLTTNYGIDDLNCVALVAKANQNRISKYQIQMLKEFKSVLGNDIGDITQLLATFASDEATAVIDVVKCAEVQFVSVYQLDNWPLYVSNNGNPESDTHIALRYRWRRMEEEYTKFFEDLQNSTPVSLIRTRDLLQERQYLEETKVTIINLMKEIDILKGAIHAHNAEISNIENQAERLKEMEKVQCLISSGHHVHNCDVCKQTCIKDCIDPSNLTAALAGTGTGVGTAAVTGIGTSVSAGAILGAEVGIFGGPIGAAIGLGIGTLIGLTAGLTTGLLMRRGKESCSDAVSSQNCTSPPCTHKMKEHKADTHYIWERRVPRQSEDTYNNLMNKLVQIKTEVKKKQDNLHDLHRGMSEPAKLLVKHTKKINELSLGHQSIHSIIDELITDERENFWHVELLQSFRSKVNKILSMEEPGDISNAHE
ncbi:uncharacterized protein [Cherax quadricarinatus]|uniref:uncharacterized protein n=1 Tax=Cherax quadricarinatus TaxID=27406 RepID=UPI00237847E7|nr:uncharacterized protein LOC128687274 [Cherax quadricarinatus]XP_053630617.1 uncharacterized protein LOC128687274 [Cherax quadricarinatus]